MTLPPGIIAEAGNTVSAHFQPADPVGFTWTGRALCKHGTVNNTTYLGGLPLNPSLMAETIYRLHDQLVPGCDCPNEEPRLNATVTFGPATAVQPGEQRYITQQSATIAPPAKNLRFGPPLTCVTPGSYAVVARVVLGKSVSQGGGGAGVLVVQGVPVLSMPMTDVAGKATADINHTLNLAVNQSVQIGFENTTSSAQDVAQTSLTVSEVWIPR